MPLSTPAITGPLSNLPPAVFDAGPFGKISVNGILSGMGLLQTNHVPGDDVKQADLSNGQVFIQKADGWFQFYLQAGAYNIPDLGAPFVNTKDSISNLWGPLPIAFIKLQAGKNTSFQIGSLPTLIGAEYTFSFENMNVERGLLWNQEPAISRGIQVNQTMGKLSASLSLNDGFYSNRYSWLTGSLAYTSGPSALSFVAGGNLSQTSNATFATPVQNDGSIYNIIYTFTKGPWIVQPYVQFTDIPSNAKIGIQSGATTKGGAILASYAFKHGFSLPVRWEYISSSGSAAQDSINLLYGPGSNATSFTVTPTFQQGGFFVRGDVAWVHAGSFTKGDVAGPLGLDNNQFRVVGEIGFIFGNNIEKK
jgi:Putative beta-barrel porin-2, OmpL-like. bbp2